MHLYILQTKWEIKKEKSIAESHLLHPQHEFTSDKETPLTWNIRVAVKKFLEFLDIESLVCREFLPHGQCVIGYFFV
jgi:hypothetical protein